MAYNDEYNVNTPTDDEPASQGDDRIRELKRALNERLDTVLEGWPDDTLKVKASALPPVEEFEQQPPTIIGTLDARPNPPTDKGLLFWATDAKELYVSVSSGESFSWEVYKPKVEVDQTIIKAQVATYDGTLPSNPISVKQDFRWMLSLRVGATTDSDGVFLLDRTALTAAGFNQPLQVQVLHAYYASTEPGDTGFIVPVVRTTTIPAPLWAYEFEFIKYDGSGLVKNRPFVMNLLLFGV